MTPITIIAQKINLLFPVSSRLRFSCIASWLLDSVPGITSQAAEFLHNHIAMQAMAAGAIRPAKPDQTSI
jgi:hypothetical protein